MRHLLESITMPTDRVSQDAVRCCLDAALTSAKDARTLFAASSDLVDAEGLATLRFLTTFPPGTSTSQIIDALLLRAMRRSIPTEATHG